MGREWLEMGEAENKSHVRKSSSYRGDGYTQLVLP